MATYIVIEIPEKENALEIMNLLMTHTKARFTITKDICEYAAEREQLKRAKKEERINLKKPAAPEGSDESGPQKKRPCPVPPRKEAGSEKIEPVRAAPQNDFENLIPKTEEQDISNFESLIGAVTNWNNTQTSQTPICYPSISEQILASSSSLNDTLNIGKTPNKRQNDTFQCQMCGAFIKAYHLDYYKRSNHAIIHTSLQRYLCPVEDCGTKTRHRSNMVVHARTVHGLKGKVDVKNCLLQHEDDELKQTVIMCFPEMEETVRNMQKKEKKRSLCEFEEGTGGGGGDSDDECVEEIAEEQ